MGARQRQHPISFPKRSEFCRWWAFLCELSSEVATFDHSGSLMLTGRLAEHSGQYEKTY